MSATMQTVSIGKKPNPVTLTDVATSKVAELLAQEDIDGLALRVAVRPGGCSGFSYEMFFDADVHVTNPNASRTCGCGSSFS
jgi:iron-sulfur cluster assembly protein/iron-sulfur cluster insertion protein